jgi:hypothetical protein
MGTQQSNMITKKEKDNKQKYIIHSQAVTSMNMLLKSDINNVNNKNQKEFLIHHRQNRDKIIKIIVSIANNRLYVYIITDLNNTISKKLIHISNANKMNNFKLLDMVCISNDMKYITIPETDSDNDNNSDNYYLNLYNLQKIIVKEQLEYITSIRITLDDFKYYIRILGSVILHRIKYINGYSEIQSVDLSTVSHTDLPSFTVLMIKEKWNIEKIRFSPNGKIISLYGLGIVRVYSLESGSYELIYSENLLFGPDLELSDYIIIDNSNIYYTLKSNTEIYYCECISSNNITSTMIIYKKHFNKSDHNNKLMYFNSNECINLFVPDLEFYSFDSQLLSLKNVVVIGEFNKTQSTLTLMIILDMHKLNKNTNTDTNTTQTNIKSSIILGMHVLDMEYDNNINYMHCSNECIIRKIKQRVIIYDIRKLLPVLIMTDIYKLIKKQIRDQISNNKSNFTLNDIIIKGADDNSCCYKIKDKIVKYCIQTSIPSDLNQNIPNQNIANHVTSSPEYQMTVNSNMTLMNTKSFTIFEDILLDKLETGKLIDILFDIYTNSIYNRFQTISEILDHFYDYTKFILLDLERSRNMLTKNNNISKNSILFKKRIALMIGYMTGSIVLDYYNREINSYSSKLSSKLLKHDNDYKINHDIANAFHHNFQPFKKIINYHLEYM